MAYQNNATDKVFDFVADKIRTNEWHPNSKIWSESELCANLTVSRIAVRQAIEKLTTMSILRKLQGSGTYVNDTKDFSLFSLPLVKLNDSDLLYLLEFRKIFEPPNVKLFIERASEEDVIRLEENYDNMENSLDNMEKYYYYDFEFHNIIANGTKNPFVIKIADTFMAILENHQRILSKSVGPVSARNWHYHILKYIKEKNTELAYAFSRQHIEHSIKVYREYSEKRSVLLS